MRISKVKETLPTCDENHKCSRMVSLQTWHIPRQRRHLIHAQLVYQLIRVQLVLLDWGSNQQNLLPITPYTRVAKKKLL